MPATTTSYSIVTGNTYPVREGLAALGGRWDPRAKVWRVPTTQLAAARALIASAGAPRRGGVRAECGRAGRLVRDLEDGLLKHRGCADMPSFGG